MIWAIRLIAPFLVFIALARLRSRVKPRTPPLVQGHSEPDDATRVATLEAPEPITQTESVAEDFKSTFDVLRDAMNLDDANLFTPLQAALVDLIGHGRRLEVSTSHLILPTLGTYVLNQGQVSAKQEFGVLEARRPCFEAVAGRSASDAATPTAAALNADLRKLLHAIGK